jgi:hypothetical protein
VGFPTIANCWQLWVTHGASTWKSRQIGTAESALLSILIALVAQAESGSGFHNLHSPQAYAHGSHKYRPSSSETWRFLDANLWPRA